MSDNADGLIEAAAEEAVAYMLSPADAEDDDLEPCDCPDKVPAVLPPEGWSCPTCDAQWWPEEEQPDV